VRQRDRGDVGSRQRRNHPQRLVDHIKAGSLHRLGQETVDDQADDRQGGQRRAHENRRQ
jgi:hypothetical protein